MDIRRTKETGVLYGFYNDDEEDNVSGRVSKGNPKCEHLMRVFINVLTDLVRQSDSRPVYVVHEVRVIYKKTRRRVLGVFASRRDAERRAAEARQMLEAFLERHAGRPFADEEHDGTLVQYWYTDKPTVIVAFSVYVEEAKFES